MTISAEQRAKIRRLFYAEHWTVGTNAAELSLHHDTVALAIETQRLGPRTLGRTVPGSILDPYKHFLLQVLTQHPRLRSTRLFEMARTRGYAGGVAQVRRWVRQVRPTPRAEAFLRLETLPGEQGQVDWGYFGKLKIGGAERVLSCFVLVLSFSRAMFARFFLDQSMESFLRGHVEAFHALEGLPRKLLYDNLKSVVLEREGEHIRFHPRILELAGHYHFAPQPCAPYRGNEKGKVERTIQYLRHSFFAARRFSSLTDLNAQLQAWIENIAHARPVPHDAQRTVADALEQERAVLLPLPEHPFGTDFMAIVHSGKRPYVRFDLNDYSIPHGLVRKPITLIASETLVRLLDGQDEVARHLRSWDRGRVIEQPAHLEALAKQKARARELSGRDRLRQCCPSVDDLLSELARRGQLISSHTQRLLRLLDRYGAAELEAAIAEAIRRGAYSAQSVAHLCDQRRRARGIAPAIELSASPDPRVRDLRVIPHSLGDYDQLSNAKNADLERDES